MPAHTVHDDGVGLLKGHALLVHALADEGVVDVGDGHDAGFQRDGVGLEALGVAGAVPALVVVVGDVLRDVAEAVVLHALENFAHDPRALGGVGLHLVELLRGEAAGLAQYGVVHGDLAQVVHGRGLDEVPAEVVRERGRAALADGFGQQAHALAGAPDVAAGGVVAALNHGGHAQYQPVVHRHDVGGLVGHLALQLGVVVAQQGDVMLILGVVGQEELIAPLVPVVEQVGDLDEVAVVVLLVVGGVAGFVVPEGLEPYKRRLPHERAAGDGAVHGQVVERREDVLGGGVAAQVVEVEVDGDEPRVAGLHQRIHGHVGDVVQGHAVDDDQVDQQREGAGSGGQLHPGKQPAPGEEGHHGHRHGHEQ